MHEEQVEDRAASHGFLDAGPGSGAPALPRGLGSLSRGALEPGRLQGYPFLVVYFSRGTLPEKWVKGHYWGT